MTTDTATFIDTVRGTGRFESDADAREATVATLETLSECIARGEAENIAEQLPDEFAEHLLVDETEEAHPLEYEAFLSQVSEKAGFERAHAQANVQAVAGALEQTLEEFEYESLRGQLPAEYDPLFEAVSGVSLIETVADETGLDEATARTAVQSTLETLAERLTLGEAEDLATHLSKEESVWLIDPDSGEAEGFSAEEFVARVADRENVDPETAREHVQQVAAGLESLAPDEIEQAVQQLGPEYSTLF